MSGWSFPIDDEWSGHTDYNAQGIQTVYVRRITLDFRVPVCGHKEGHRECRLPPDHGLADVRHIYWGADPEGKFVSFVKVTTHNPKEPKPWEFDSTLDADAILSMDS